MIRPVAANKDLRVSLYFLIFFLFLIPSNRRKYKKYKSLRKLEESGTNPFPAPGNPSLTPIKYAIRQWINETKLPLTIVVPNLLSSISCAALSITTYP